MGRWVGGVFGNTKSSGDTIDNINGVYSMTDQNYIKSEGGWQVIYDGSTEDLAAESAQAIKDVTTQNNDGLYWIKPPGQSTAYQTYCMMNGSNAYTFDGGGWTLAYNLRFDQTAWNHSNDSTANTSPFYYGTTASGGGWTYWTGTTPSNYGGSTQFDVGSTGRAPGAYIEADKIMIMTLDSSTTYASAGASCWYQRDTSWNSGTKKSLRDIFESAGNTSGAGTNGIERDIVWSSGGRKGIWSAGTLSTPTWNSNRADQGFTGDPFYQTGNTYGSGTGAGTALSGFELVLNAEEIYESDASDNRTRITTTMCADSFNGNNYGHTVQHGIGNYHSHSGYGGSTPKMNGQGSYCDGTMNHVPYSQAHFRNHSSDSFGGSCASGSPDGTHYGFAIFVK